MNDKSASRPARSLQRTAVLFVAPLLVVALAAVLIEAHPTKFKLADYEFLVIGLAVYAAVVFGGRMRNVATLVASVMIGLFAIEVASAMLAPNIPATSKGFSVSHPILGWAPSGAGTYHARKLAPDGSVVYDVSYTIDAPGLRRTLAGTSGPLVAFFGDSFTFGEGLDDPDTLPQSFADIDGRHLRVINFGFSGYGPQQFLRAIETGMFDRLLTGAKVFVFQTSAWHAERSSCVADFSIRAPRYVLKGDDPVFTGPCTEGLDRKLHEFLGNSATFRFLLEPLRGAIGGKDIDLYIAEVRQAAALARAKYGAPTVVLYDPADPAYMKSIGTTNDAIEARFRAAGLLVVDGTLEPADFPAGTALSIHGDGHPTGIANRARARRLYDFLKKNLPDLTATNGAQ